MSIKGKPHSRLAFFLVGLLVLAGVCPAGAASGPGLHFESHLLDQAGLLPPSAAEELAALLAQFDKETGNQFLVAILPALPPGERIENYALQIGESAGAGEKGKDNGLLLLVCLEERLIRIEVGTGLEGQITDGRAGRVIRQILAPAFQERNYAGGLKEALLTMMGWVEPSFTPAMTVTASAEEEPDAVFLLALFIGLLILSSVYARWERRRWYKRGFSQRTGGPLLSPPVRRPLGSPSRPLPRRGGGSFRSGGFRGGGGGFRGGGASGGW
ncbi:MAG: TPM domain-containing protein [Firmicutes bacterium]|nr:TPM domain-containing protein [Bacillota bacterium]